MGHKYRGKIKREVGAWHNATPLNASLTAAIWKEKFTVTSLTLVCLCISYFHLSYYFLYQNKSCLLPHNEY